MNPVLYSLIFPSPCKMPSA